MTALPVLCVLASVTLLLVGDRALPPRPRRPRRRASPPSAGEAAYADLLALGLEAGLPRDRAATLAEELHGGRGIVAGSLLDQAWRQSEDLGTPVAQVVRECARVLGEKERARARVDTALAGPRASMWVLTGLPLLGPLLAAALGLGPDLGHPAVGLAVAVGLGCTALGWVWSHRIVARAARPRPIPPPRGGP